MSSRNVIDFLRTVAVRVDVLDSLKVKSKSEVIATAAAFGFPFSELEFDSLIWNLEARLASKRGEQFDAQFSLWQTMWGKYYLEYLVIDLMPSFEQADLDSVTAGTSHPRMDQRKAPTRRSSRGRSSPYQRIPGPE